MIHELDCSRSAFVVHIFHSYDDPEPAIVPRTAIAEWCREQFGYIPEGRMIAGRPTLLFRFPEDAALCRIHFGHLWSRG